MSVELGDTMARLRLLERETTELRLLLQRLENTASRLQLSAHHHLRVELTEQFPTTLPNGAHANVLDWEGNVIEGDVDCQEFGVASGTIPSGTKLWAIQMDDYESVELQVFQP